MDVIDTATDSVVDVIDFVPGSAPTGIAIADVPPIVRPPPEQPLADPPAGEGQCEAQVSPRKAVQRTDRAGAGRGRLSRRHPPRHGGADLRARLGRGNAVRGLLGQRRQALQNAGRRGGARNHLAGGRRCDRSTLFKVTEGVLSVRDDVNRKTMTLREGMRCVAQEAAEVTGATVLEPAASGVTGAVGDKGSSGQFPAFPCGMTHLTPPLYGPAQLPANSGRLQARLGTGARWISHARVDSLLGRMALPAEVKKDAVALVTTYCATKIPAEHDDKIRIEYKVRGNAVTLCQGSER